MSIEALLERVATGLEANTAVLERVVAGQAAAMEKLDGAKATRTPRGAKATPETPSAGNAAGGEPAVTETPAADAGNASDRPTDEASLKAYAMANTDDPAVKAARVALLQSMAKHFGCKPNFAELSATPDRLKQTTFFVDRANAAVEIDFDAAYDFDGAPDQEVEDAGDFA